MDHINIKILDDIKNTLHDKYEVFIENDVWDLFKISIKTNDDFLLRQTKSISIIKQILERHGKSEILTYIKQLAILEPNIQELQEWVRDHVVHAINTFITGIYIIENLDFNFSEDFSFMWKLSGATHDLGYPFEIANNISVNYFDKINEQINKAGSTSPRILVSSCIENLNLLSRDVDSEDLIQKRLNQWKLDLVISEYRVWLSTNGIVDHGVIGALVQMKVIDMIYEKYNPKNQRGSFEVGGFDYNYDFFTNDILNASTALYIHNIPLKYPGFKNKIDFNNAPLAFLLYLCDTFQEWDRFADNRKVYSGEEFDIDCIDNTVLLYVPSELLTDITKKLSQRLEGLTIKVNDKIAVE